jgi:hypothetical protein
MMEVNILECNPQELKYQFQTCDILSWINYQQQIGVHAYFLPTSICIA